MDASNPNGDECRCVVGPDPMRYGLMPTPPAITLDTLTVEGDQILGLFPAT
jgi:hypothetical protein